MATLFTERSGSRRIQFRFDGRRRSLRLGKVTQRQAESVRVKIEGIIAANQSNLPMDGETSAWIGGISDELHERLAQVGMVKAKSPVADRRIGAFIDRFNADRPDSQTRTLINMLQVRRWLVAFFGELKDMAEINAVDANNFRLFMIKAGLAEATYHRHLGRCRQLFKRAIKLGILRGENPFADMSVTVRANKDRQFFVSRESADKLIAACPDAQWRLMVALSRYGGIRTPSETLAIKWNDINWEHNRIRIPSPKTARYAGKDCREIPLFPELRKPLMDVFEQAHAGEEFIITRYRSTSQNLRTQLLRIAYRAGVTPWPKLWHNMRASRQTELAESYPIHVVCEWIGNSRAVAQEHYLQLTDAHFQKAIGQVTPPLAGVVQNAVQQASETDGKGLNTVSTGDQNATIYNGLRTHADVDMFINARDRIRTCKSLRPPAPQAGASANFATRATLQHLAINLEEPQVFKVSSCQRGCIPLHRKSRCAFGRRPELFSLR